MSNDDVDLHALQATYATALDEYEGAAMKLNEARSAECAAVNRLNEAQNAIDDALDTMRSSAPNASDWLRRRVSKS